MRKTKLKDWLYLTLGFTKELQSLKQCSICERLDQQNRFENPETEQHKNSQLIFDKEQRQFSERRTDFATNGTGTTRHQHAKKKKNLEMFKESRPYSVTGTNFTAHRNAKCHSHYATPAINFVQSLT